MPKNLHSHGNPVSYSTWNDPMSLASNQLPDTIPSASIGFAGGKGAGGGGRGVLC